MIGRRLAQRYELLEELEPGWLGRVFLAEDPLLERRVLVKIFEASNTAGSALDLESLIVEGRRIARLSHPVIARLFDVGRHGDSVFFVLPRPRGEGLDRWSHDRLLDFGDLLTIGADIAAALAHAADRGVLHRDVRPETILVAREHGQLRCWLTGFYPIEVQPTAAGGVDGPAVLRTPEARLCLGFDHRSDLYCLARSLGRILLGEDGPQGAPIPPGRPEGEILRPQTTWMAGLAPELVDGLDRSLGAALAENPSDRPSSGADFGQMLRQVRERVSESLLRRRPTHRARRPTFQRPDLVGRDFEIERLNERLEGLEAAGSHFVLVAAEAGMGATRLLEELEERALERGFTVLWSRFARQAAGQPLAGFQHLIEELLRRRGETDEGAAAILGPWLGELSLLLPSLLEHPALADETPVGETVEGLHGDPREVLARAMISLAGERPMVLLIENLHGDEVSYEALAHLVRRLGPKPILVAGTYRPSEVTAEHPLRASLRSAHDDPRLDVLRLDALGAEDHAKLCAGLLELPGLPLTLAAELLEATDGNPYFTRELVRSLVESGDLPRPGTTVWGLRSEWASELVVAEGGLTLPASIQQVVERRLSGLDQELVRLLETASVLGSSFTLRLLLAIADGSAERIEDGIDALVRSGLLEEEGRTRGGALRFSGSVLQDVLYRRLPERRRRALHRHCAEVMERRWAGRLERTYPQLVHHFGCADRPVETLTYALMLARRSADRWSPRQVVRAAQRGLEVLAAGGLGDEAGDAGDVEGELRRLLAGALERQGALGAAIREAGASALAFERAGETVAAGRSAALAAGAAWRGRRVVAARRWSRWALERWPTAAREADGRHLLALGALLAELAGDGPGARRCRLDLERSAHPVSTSTPCPALHIALGEKVSALDPARARGLAIEPSSAVYETLFRQRPEGGMEPWLAESVEEVAPGQLEITLREGIRFQDGRPLTAEAVAHSLERLATEGDTTARRPIESLLDGVRGGLSGVETMGRSRLRLCSHSSEPLLPWLLTSPSTAIALPSREPGGEPVGTGPYRCRRAGPGLLELGAWSGYWRPDRPRTKTLLFEHGASAEALLEGARSGSLALALGLPDGVVEGLRRRAVPGVRTFEIPAFSTLLLWLDPRRPVWRRRRHRRAFVASLGLEAWLIPSLGCGAVRASSLWPPGLPGAGGRPVDEGALGEGDEQDIAPEGRLVAWVDASARREHEALWRGLARAITRRGVDLEVRVREGCALPTSLADDGIDLVFGRWDAAYLDGAAFLDLMGNPTIAASLPERLSEQVETARRCVAPGLRASLLQQIHRELWHEALLVPLGHEQHHGFAVSELGELDFSPVRPELRYESLALTS